MKLSIWYHPCYHSSINKIRGCEMRDMYNHSIKYKVEYLTVTGGNGDESDKQLEARDRTYLCSCSISEKGLITLVTKIQFLHAKWYSHSSFRCVFLKNVANSSALMMRKVAWFLFCFHALSKMLFICSWLQTFQKTSISQWCCRLKLPKNLEQRMVKIELRLIWRLPASLPLHKRLPTCALLLNDSK